MPRKRILTEQEIAEKAKRLIHLIEFSQINRKDLCQDTGIKSDTLYRWMHGRLQGIGSTGAVSLLAKLREVGVICSEDWLLTGEGRPPFRASASSVMQGTDALDSEGLLALDKEIKFFHENNPGSMGHFLKDNALQPVFMKGDYVAGIRTFQIEKVLGEFCVVQLDNGDVLSCRLEAGSDKDSFTLLSLVPTESRPLVLLNQKVIAVARIIWRRCQNF